MNCIDKCGNWFSEVNSMWPGQCFSLEVEEVLFHEKSDFQDVMVFKSKTYGNVLVLDGVIQCTERDEFSYQEILAHVPLFCHPCPKKVLIIGGGDGGVAREVCKHDCVEELVLCEIDKMVIDVSKKYLPFMAESFSNPKFTVHNGDGFAFLKNHHCSYDVIITDSSDPVGPAESLFTEEYFSLLKKCLKPHGIVCSQGESIWLNLDLLCDMQRFCCKMFPRVRYASTGIPSYPCGQIGFVICSLDETLPLEVPARKMSVEEVKRFKLRYYNSKVHTAAFVLPNFVIEALKNSKSSR